MARAASRGPLHLPWALLCCIGRPWKVLECWFSREGEHKGLPAQEPASLSLLPAGACEDGWSHGTDPLRAHTRQAAPWEHGPACSVPPWGASGRNESLPSTPRGWHPVYPGDAKAGKWASSVALTGGARHLDSRHLAALGAGGAWAAPSAAPPRTTFSRSGVVGHCLPQPQPSAQQPLRAAIPDFSEEAMSALRGLTTTHGQACVFRKPGWGDLGGPTGKGLGVPDRCGSSDWVFQLRPFSHLQADTGVHSPGAWPGDSPRQLGPTGSSEVPARSPRARRCRLPNRPGADTPLISCQERGTV